MGCELSCDISITSRWHVHRHASAFVELAKKLRLMVDAGVTAIEIVNKAVMKISTTL